MDERNYKQCAWCKDVFPKAEFYKNKATKDGIDSYCKECRNNKKRAPLTKDSLPNGRALKMEDFYHPEKKWKKLETWNKFDISRLNEVLYNGGDISEVFHMKVHERLDYEKSKKKKRKWGQ